MILPGFGIISEVIPVFSRKPIFGYKAIAASTAVIAFLATLVWAHHMFASPVPIVVLGFFMLSSFLIGDPHRGQDLQLDRDAVARIDRDDDRVVVRDRLHRDLHDRRHHRDLPGGVPGRLAAQRHLLRRRPLPLRADGRLRVHRVLRDLLLVPEDDRPDARRAGRQVVVLGHVHRLQHDVLRPARARAVRDAAADLHLPARARVVHLQFDLDDRSLHPWRRGSDHDPERRPEPQARQDRRPGSLEGKHARVVHDFASAGQQLRRDPARTLGRADARHPPPDRAPDGRRAEDRRQRAVRPGV